jgi:hypothetical protein
LAPQIVAGTYHYSIGPRLTDLAGNEMNQDGDWVNGAGDDAYRGSFEIAADPASFPLEEGFEAGNPDVLAAWSFNLEGGSINIASSRSHTGSYSLQMCDDVNYISGYQDAVLHVNLEGRAAVALEYWAWKYNGNYSWMEVSISADGIHWLGLDAEPMDEAQRHYAFDLDSLGLAFSSDTQIRFRHVNWCGSGAAIDDVRVSSAETVDMPPSPFRSIDIGGVRLRGGAEFANPTLALHGSGLDIGDRSDAFHFAYQTLDGDGTITARVLSLGNTNEWAKAGVMIRESLARSSRHAMVVVTPAHGVAFEGRYQAGDYSFNENSGAGSVTAPYWVRLVREGNTFTAFSSPDGIAFTRLGDPQAVNMAGNVLIGLCVTAHDDTALNTATFGRITITRSLPAPFRGADVGDVALAGSSRFADDAFTIRGSGADIWAQADAFRFVYQPLDGDGSITARVLSEDNTSEWAKAGVMIRQSLAADAPHAMAIVTPANGIAFEFREVVGGNSSNVNTGAGNGAAPYWVRLVRQGNTVTAYNSPDGVNFTQLGNPTTIEMGPAVLIGLAVTAHDNSQLCTATFDHVTVVRAAAPVVIDGTAGDDTLYLRRDPGATNLELWLNEPVGGSGTPTRLIAMADIARLIIDGHDGDDRVTLAGDLPCPVTLSNTDIADVDPLGASSVVLGPLTINDGARLNLPAAAHMVLRTSGLALRGILDLADNALILCHADDDHGEAALAQVTAFLHTGINLPNGYWDGPGINSSTAANDASALTSVGVINNDLGDGTPFYTEFAGQTVDQNCILVKYTYYGDNNLDGKVDLENDFSLFVDGYNSAGAKAGWLWGDYNYDGNIDLDNDFSMFVSAFNNQGQPLEARELTARAGQLEQRTLEQRSDVATKRRRGSTAEGGRAKHGGRKLGGRVSARRAVFAGLRGGCFWYSPGGGV